MAYTAVITVVTGDIIPASYGNTYLRDNMAYLKSLLDGTGGAVTVTVPNALRITNDSFFGLRNPGGGPLFEVDSGDYFYFDRATNTFQWVVGSVQKFLLDSNGKLTGAGFYSSGEVAVATGGSVAVNHGLGARPRFVQVWGSTASGAENSKTTPYSVGSATSTQLTFAQNTGVTLYINFYAML